MLTVATLAQNAHVRPDSTAIVDIEHEITWSRLAQRVAQAAGYLREHDLRRGDRVGLALHDDADFVIVLLAALQLGLVATPLDWRCRAPERNALRSAFALRALVTPASAARGQVEHIPWPMPDGQSPSKMVEPIGPDEPCMILLSSGTTGQPSGAVISRAALEHRITAGGDAAFALAGHRYLSFLPLCLASGISQVLRNLVAGNSVIVHPALFTASELIEASLRHSATYIGIVPATLRSLLHLSDAELRGLAQLRAIRLGGSAMTLEDREASALRIDVPLYHSYGTSAFGPLCHWSSIAPNLPPGSVGKLYPWVQHRIVDLDGLEQTAGAVGKLECRGPPLATDLLSFDGEITSLRGRWYAPGDLVRLDHDGHLFIAGRATDVIIRSGFNVYPEIVEEAILKNPAVQEVAVIGLPRGHGEEEVAAYVVLRAPLAPEELAAHCRVHLSAKFRPAEIHVVADLPRTVSGKVKRHELRGSAASD